MTVKVIPQQWVNVPLEEVIQRIVGGGTPSKSKPEYYQGDIPWMSVKDMNKQVLIDTVDHISPEAVENSSTNIIPAGIPIIATRMSLGKIVTAHFDSAINQDLKALFLPAEIHRDYLVYWYRSVARLIEQMGTGTTVKGIRLEALKGLEFSLPPLAEQKVIVDKLDTLLIQVENTKARLERIPQILKRFRQSVLAAAVSGRLTGLPDDIFKPTPVEQLAKKQKYSLGIGPFGSNLKVSDYRKSGHPLVFVREIRAIQFGDSATKFVSSEKFQELKAHRVLPGDILITKMGDPPGDVAIYPLSRPEAVITADCIKLSVDESFACRDYVAYAMQSEQFRLAVLSISAGVAQQKVNLTKFRKLELQLPPLFEQARIVSRVDQLFAHADRIELQVNQALARVNNLSQSILAKAFRGELTEQWRKDNPELISGENSAEALLERIKAERAAKAPAKRTRKKATA
ncbi:restriction endonuclease subunit S [Halomonas sp. SpR1]|uniref:restriction endonuclease subunit S n=1 Tax=Halomonas sp. SpR1 TaxID=3050462 RepID=UPI0027E3F813|nr:restriction endonuclease subunit S [Halomonas sp. SpR1]MDQ7733890.1 restriction endonuclease subunit S [Halomonas sp. SpR1]